MFGVCLQAVGSGTAVNTSSFTLDATNTPGVCQATDADPWEAVAGDADQGRVRDHGRSRRSDRPRVGPSYRGEPSPGRLLGNRHHRRAGAQCLSCARHTRMRVLRIVGDRARGLWLVSDRIGPGWCGVVDGRGNRRRCRARSRSPTPARRRRRISSEPCCRVRRPPPRRGLVSVASRSSRTTTPR